MQLIDSHCHLDFPEFDHDRAQVIRRSQALGVSHMLLAGTTQATWQRLLATLKEFPNLYGALGLHPYFLAEHQALHLQQLAKQLSSQASNPQLVAVGEIGLDFQLPELDRSQQHYFFEQQLALAYEFNLPAIIHVRKAHAPTIATLKRFKLPRGGIIHAFNGSPEQAKEYIKLGFYLGIGGAYTWPNATRLQRTLQQLPLDSLLLETDSPDMAPSFAANQRNSPENLPQICQQVAQILQVSPEQLAKHSSQNFHQLFQLTAAQ
ncbi:TatD family hydrolase [Thiopseudomonas alkaliphila]|uniref:TatD family hydrolase n=1 Tax=Thiopseudomonas alkaliphila TaxID=1697053 RepID=UPI002577EE2C|nr:TatD family hydrolase [Thiopseudomonas alkaliphila]MDM1716833.1 TatD family hydrolase [Thiopseudomonas alkaliphila]